MSRENQKEKEVILKSETDKYENAKTRLALLQLKLQFLQENVGGMEQDYSALKERDLRLRTKIQENRQILEKTPAGRRILRQFELGSPSLVTLAPVLPTTVAPSESTVVAPVSDVEQRKLDTIKRQLEEAAALREKIENYKIAVQTAPRDVPLPVEQPLPSDSQVVVYTGAGVPANKKHREITPEVYVDGVPYAFVVPFTSFTLSLPPGPHKVCVVDAFTPCGDIYTINLGLRSQQTVFLRISPDAKNLNYVPSTVGADDAERRRTVRFAFPRDQVINNMPVQP